MKPVGAGISEIIDAGGGIVEAGWSFDSASPRVSETTRRYKKQTARLVEQSGRLKIVGAFAPEQGGRYHSRRWRQCQ